MQFPVLRETPDNSGQFVATGEVFEGDVASVIARVLNLTVSTGSRHAIHPYDPVRRADVSPDAVPTAPAEPTPEAYAAAVAAVSEPQPVSAGA